MSIFVLHESNNCQQGPGSIITHQAVHIEIQMKTILQSFKKNLWIPLIFLLLFLKHPKSYLTGFGVCVLSYVSVCVCVDCLSCKTQGQELYLCYDCATMGTLETQWSSLIPIVQTNIIFE